MNWGSSEKLYVSFGMCVVFESITFRKIREVVNVKGIVYVN
jgi:hypothetical protein